MKFVVALDKFKHGLDATAACAVVADELRARFPSAEVIVKPMADGGEGTARALVAARGGTWVPVRVADPLGRTIDAGYGWFEADRSAVVEMASASGITLLQQDELDPARTTTYGTGQLIEAARQRGATSVLLGVGGSATVDGGVGAATALGWKFLDANGQPIGPGGGELARIARLEPPADGRVPIPIRVLCDVDNPLGGPRGAAAVFGPQKGASPAMVAALDDGLRHLANLVRQQLGADILDTPGGGAAGGLAAGAMAFLGAALVPGIDTVIACTGLDDALRDADWVITGEGRFDEQSLHGKVVSGIAARARTAGVRVAVLAGQVAVSEKDYRAAGIERALAISPADLAPAQAIPRTAELLRAATAAFTATV